MPRVCVVGAGPSGLVTTKTLARDGIDVDCYEMSSVIGGQWVMDNPNGFSAVYESLALNTPRVMSRLSDFSFPADAPTHVAHADVRAWWNEYVRTFRFEECIHLNTRVVTALQREGGGWNVVVESDGQRTTHEFDALVCCSGGFWKPHMPAFPGDFAGEEFHAQQYRSPVRPVELNGRRVVVVGTGSTGCEIACEVAAAGAQSVHLVARSGNWIVPSVPNHLALTHPMDRVPGLLRRLHRRLRPMVMNVFARRAFKSRYGRHAARLRAVGMPRPPRDPLSKRLTFSADLLPALESGAVVAKPNIARTHGRIVEFDDESRVEADVLIYATGYELSFPYLSTDLLDTSKGDLQLFLGTMHPHIHDLFVVGVCRPTGAFWPIAEVQARFAVGVIKGRYELPGQLEINRRSRNVLNRTSLNPALFALEVREELLRGQVSRLGSN